MSTSTKLLETILCGLHISAHFAREALIALLSWTIFSRMYSKQPWKKKIVFPSETEILCMFVIQYNKDNASLRENTEMLTAYYKIFGFPKFRVASACAAVTWLPLLFLCFHHPAGIRELTKEKKNSYILTIAVTVSNKQSFVSYSGIFFVVCHQYPQNGGSLTC